MATQVTQPLPNVDYGLTLGVSFAPEAGEEVETSYAALRYDFRPASADMDQPGVLLLGKDNRVSLYLANSATCEWDVLFAGKYEPYSNGGAAGTASGRDCLDCVALFDPTTGTFRLETLLGQYNTKHIRDAPPYRAPLDDHMQLSPGTSGSAGPGPSTSPTGPNNPQASQAQRRADSPLGSHGGSEDLGPSAGGPQRQAGQGHDRYGGGAGGTTAGSSGGGAAAGGGGVAGAKPPRPPVAGGTGRSGAAAAAAAGGGQGKKRQRDGGGAGQSPNGGPARKTSRLARASGPQRQEQEQPAKAPPARAQSGQAAKPAQQPGNQQQQQQQARHQSQQRQQQHHHGAASAAGGDGGEDDVDAALLDAFDTFDSFDAEPVGSAGDVGGDEADGDGAVHNVAASTPVVADAAQPPPTAPPPTAPAPTPPPVAPTPTLEEEHGHEQEEEEEEEERHDVHEHHEEEHEELAQPLPGARLVVDAVDDDEGYGYGADDEMGLGIEYF